MLNRDQVIKLVADIVGPKHKVDIKNHDVLILVDIYKASYIYYPDDAADKAPAAYRNPVSCVTIADLTQWVISTEYVWDECCEGL